MAAYLVLKNRFTGEVYQGRKLIIVDELYCLAFGLTCSPTEWADNWMDTIGMTLAFWGEKGWEKLTEFWPDQPAVAWFREYFENLSYSGF